MDDITQNTPQTTSVVQDEQTTTQALPGSILNHLNSQEVLDVIYGIEKDFSIQANNIRVIPIIISEIITGELSPEGVVLALKATLETTEEDAIKIASIIKDKILNPVAGGLLLVAGIDIEPIPGSSAKDAKDLPELVKELEPYLMNPESIPAAQNPAPATPKQTEGLEPLMAAPQKRVPEVAPRPHIPGMETSGLRVMKDVKPPTTPPKPAEVKKPVTPAPKTVATARPFMLHEEKPVAPNEPAVLQVNKNFSFDVGATPASHTPAKPVMAQLNPSYEAVLDQKKPPSSTVSKTVEQPKVVHYTNLRTPPEGEKPTNRQSIN